MSFLTIAFTALSCVLAQVPTTTCWMPLSNVSGAQTRSVANIPQKTGESLDVVLSAKAALVWDLKTDAILYDKNADTERPIASINKLLSALTIRQTLALDDVVEIPTDVRKAQRAGASISLPVGQHATVRNLLAASMIASANDAMVTLAVASDGSEEKFAEHANRYAKEHGLAHTVAANATGLTGGTQYSTANDIKTMLSKAYNDSFLSDLLNQPTGTLVTTEGTKRDYKSTDELLNTYMPILAAKTGYTIEAGENLAIITEGKNGQRIGAVILGSSDRFHDMKVLVEWIWRNYTWPE